MKTKRLVILGSTGSIGVQTLEVVRSLGERFQVLGLAAGRNVTLLEEQARQFQPRLIWSEDDGARRALEAAAGPGARWTPLEEQAAHPDADLVVVGTVGRAGLMPTLAALRAGKAVALANKEVLVMAGAVVTRAAAQGKGQLLPIDSEHSAIWQCLWGERRSSIARILLTASGGAFRDYTQEQLARVTPEEAMQHPTWQMGRKITVDSATLINKGFEAIETRWLFDVPLERIEVVLHRESIVHSLVEFVDGCVKAQLGEPDMRVPIRIALCYPERVPNAARSPIDLARIGELHFDAPDFRRFPALSLGLKAGRRGGTYPAALAAADEVAVNHFLAGRLRFTDIAGLLEDVLSTHVSAADTDLEAVLEADAWARTYAEDWVRAKV
ncbi:MAG: 1-deoxy-D-xylulose-5-phosphate reductoisomerase [Chloroflexi bacterium RBG_16_68_14]|nr:MAG: 1-deoxy-D-xylulose-5-phosphate reductoisomerase [Chloroflexi bacterium RBG_16_68_14]